MKTDNSIPGVLFTHASGQPFYVDVLWAMAIGSREDLEIMLALDNDRFSDKLKELCLTPLMRKTYSIAYFLIQRNTQKEGEAHDQWFIDWYYHKLSPAMVPWQLDHPRANKLLAKVVSAIATALLWFWRAPVLEDEEIFLAKNVLIKYKKTHYAGQSNEEIKKFLSKYRQAQS